MAVFAHMKRSKKFGFLAPPMLLLTLAPVSALADIPMFLALPITKLTFWWTVLLAIAIEAAAIRWIFQFTWKRSTVASLTVNLATFLLGLVLYPEIGMSLYPVLEPLVTRLTGGGVFVELGVTLAISTLLDTAVELGLLRAVFDAGIVLRSALLFLLANVLTASIFFILIT